MKNRECEIENGPIGRFQFPILHLKCKIENKLNQALLLLNSTFSIWFGGPGWIRTSEGVSQQIYSLPPLATWVSYRSRKSVQKRCAIKPNHSGLVNQPCTISHGQPCLPKPWVRGARRSRRFNSPCSMDSQFTNPFSVATRKRRERRAPRTANHTWMHRRREAVHAQGHRPAHSSSASLPSSPQ